MVLSYIFTKKLLERRGFSKNIFTNIVQKSIIVLDIEKTCSFTIKKRDVINLNENYNVETIANNST